MYQSVSRPIKMTSKRKKPVVQKTKRKRNEILQRGNKRVISKALREQLAHFCEYHSAGRLSKNLRTMLLEFLMQDGVTEADYLQNLLFDLHGVFDLLEVIESENNRLLTN
jgi:hypothetical protein